jgi:hypothetical protein
MKSRAEHFETTEFAMPSASPSLCVLSCKWGDGHHRVGEAVAAAWRASTGGAAGVLDYFAEFVHPLFTMLGTLASVQAVRHRPALYGKGVRGHRPHRAVGLGAPRVHLARNALSIARPDAADNVVDDLIALADSPRAGTARDMAHGAHRS